MQAVKTDNVTRLSYPREERVFKRDQRWYFRTPNSGDEKGPFIDKQNAYWALARHIRIETSF